MRRWPWVLPIALVTLACVSPGTRTEPRDHPIGARPEINERFLSPDLDVQQLTETFESESREVFVQRHEIVAQLGLSPGMAVADVGAGTGLFLEPLVSGVGPAGKVYAVEIAPKLVDHLRERARTAGWSQVETVLCSERSAGLPQGAVDLVFLCDTYHHLEYPQSTLASLYRALRPGGRLVVVDFERVPGVSRDWVVDHVRAGREEVRAEIEAAGFIFEDRPRIDGLEENYVLRFTRPEARPSDGSPEK